MLMQRELALEDYIDIARRRWWMLVVPAVVFSISAYTISRFLPSRYTSQTVVLVEEPVVPENLVKPVVGGDVNQRLATMQEQILSRTRLQQIIEKFGLYKEEDGRNSISMEDKVALLRKDITVSPVRPMAETRASGLPGFTVSVVAGQPYTAQQICTEITSFFMQQNVLLRERRAEDTTQFITKQLGEAKRKLDDQDAKLADFQRRYMGELPDEMPANFSMLTGLSSQLDATSQALNRAQQDKLYLESELQQQVAAQRAVRKAPDQPVLDPDALERQLAQQKSQLAALRTQYTDRHPDVRRLEKDIALLEKKIEDDTKARAAAASAAQVNPQPEEMAQVDTPQVKQLRIQLRQINENIADKTRQQGHIQEEINSLQGKLRLTPAIAQEYKALTRDYQTALNIYNDLLKKQNDSEMATDLERRQQGEQFRVLDAPSLPQKRTSPNRPLFAAGGFMGGLALGLGIVFLLEMQDTTFHSERDIERVLKLPALAMIPLLEKASKQDGKKTVPLTPAAETVFSGTVS